MHNVSPYPLMDLFLGFEACGTVMASECWLRCGVCVVTGYTTPRK